MRSGVTQDDVTEIEVSDEGGPAELRTRARSVLELVEAGETVADQTPVDLMVIAAEWLQMAGDVDEAEVVLTEAIARGGPAAIDPRAMLCHQLLEREKTDRARDLSQQMRKDRDLTPTSYLLNGESWEMAGDLKEAIRWFTLGLLRSGDQPTATSTLLGFSRHRVRRAAGLPVDSIDEATERAQATIDQQHVDRSPGQADDQQAPGRRQPCPCGSGRRYKNCHGQREGRGDRAIGPFTPFASLPMGSDGKWDYHLDFVGPDTPEG